MKGMTGFVSQDFKGREFALHCTLRSFNHKYLEISFNLPPELQEMELEFRKEVQKNINRGYIQANIYLEKFYVQKAVINKGQLEYF